MGSDQKKSIKKKPYLTSEMRSKLSKEITKKFKKISIKQYDQKIKSKNTYYFLNFFKKKIKKIKFFLL